jgi:hypothetical protein
MKQLARLVLLIATSVTFTNISFGNLSNLDRFHKIVVFGDSLSDNGKALPKPERPPRLVSRAVARLASTGSITFRESLTISNR